MSSFLAIVLLLTTIPLTSGVVITSGPSQPQLTVNICQPIQSFDCVSNNLLARPSIESPRFALALLGPPTAEPDARTTEFKAAPDIPPPKRPI